MQKSKVAIIKCQSYAQTELRPALSRGIELLGGITKFVKNREKILLKLNVLFGDHPDKCTATHPAVLEAVAWLFKEKGADLYYGDSPGFGSPAQQMKSGQFAPVAAEWNLKLGDFEQGRDVDLAGLEHIDKIRIVNAVHQADGVINLCKMKTHGLTRITGAVKNTFGCVPGLLKPAFHVKARSTHEFCRILVAISQAVKPRLHIMDGIMAMEGNGPRGGEPASMHVLLLSEDPVALDAVMCRLINLNPEFVPTITEGENMGLGKYRENELELVGDSPAELKNDSFRIRHEPVPDIRKRSVMRFFINLYIHRPVIEQRLCIKCGMCVNTCPVNPKAVNWKKNNKKNPPVYTYSNCIRCFCCQEVCPEKAITVKYPLLGRLLLKRKN